jgi:hypothetical protein
MISRQPRSTCRTYCSSLPIWWIILRVSIWFLLTAISPHSWCLKLIALGSLLVYRLLFNWSCHNHSIFIFWIFYKLLLLLHLFLNKVVIAQSLLLILLILLTFLFKLLLLLLLCCIWWVLWLFLVVLDVKILVD